MHINIHEFQKKADIMVIKFTSISNGKDAALGFSRLETQALVCMAKQEQ